MTALSVFNFMVLDPCYRDEKPLEEQVLPQYASIGGYTIAYYTEAGNFLCARCATAEIRAWQVDLSDDPPVAYGTYDEGPPQVCDECNKVIESSYGDPADDKPPNIDQMGL